MDELDARHQLTLVKAHTRATRVLQDQLDEG